MKLYPIKFKEIYKDYIWGGSGFEKLNKQPPNDFAAESWEVSCHKDGMSVAENGYLKGKKFKELINEYGSDLIGTRSDCRNGDFPLLVKFINANKKLSVQVHPNDEYALLHENQKGKNEAWIILDAEEGSELIYGLKKNTTKSDLKKAIEAESLEKHLDKVKVKKGDVIYIPSGKIHAIGEGIMLLEVQQNSNVTYRVYDYNRKNNDGNKRQLHVKEALEVIDFASSGSEGKIEGISVGLGDDSLRKIYIASTCFCLEVFSINKEITQTTHNETFLIYTIISGEGYIGYGNEKVYVKTGDTYLVPASMGIFEMGGEMQFVKTYIPDMEKDIMQPLGQLGYTQKEITENIRG